MSEKNKKNLVIFNALYGSYISAVGLDQVESFDTTAILYHICSGELSLFN